MCNPRYQMQSRAPTSTTDRQCLSDLAAYTAVTFQTVVPIEDLNTTQTNLEESVLDGSLLSLLQGSSPFYNGVTLVYLPVPNTPTLADNPPSGQAYVIASIKLTGFALSSFTARPVYDFILALSSLTSVNTPFISIVGSNSSSSGSDLQVLFRLQVADSVAIASRNNLTNILNGSHLLSVLTTVNNAFQQAQGIVVTVEPYIIRSVICVFCNISMSMPSYWYRPFQCSASLVGNCAACSQCPFGTYVANPCTGADDTICMPVPHFTSAVSLQLDASIGLPLSGSQGLSSHLFTRNFTEAGQAPGAEGIVSVSLGSSGRMTQNSSFTNPLGLPVYISATLLDKITYFDNPRIRVAVQVRDDAFNVKTQATMVSVTVSSSNMQVSDVCSPDSNTGICIVSLTGNSLNGFFNLSGNHTLSVTYGFQSPTVGQQSAKSLTQTVLAISSPRYTTFSNNMQAVFPSSDVYVGDFVSVPVYGHAAMAIGSFAVSIQVIGDSLSLQNIVVSDSSLYLASTVVSDTSLGAITATPQQPLLAQALLSKAVNGVQIDQLLFIVNLKVIGTGVAYVRMVANQFALADSLQSIPVNGAVVTFSQPITVLASGRLPQYPNGLGAIYCVSDSPLALFAVPLQGTLVNKANLTSVRQTFPLSIFSISGKTDTGTVAPVISGVTCTSSASEIVQVDGSCSSLFFDGKETAGANQVNVSVSMNGMSSITFPVRVWAPSTPISITADYPTLAAIQGVKNPAAGCGPQFMHTAIRASVVFSTGDASSFTADITSLMIPYLTSSNPNVATVDIVTGIAQGVNPGVATISLSTSHAVNSVTVNVTLAEVMVSGLDVVVVSHISSNLSLSEHALSVFGDAISGSVNEEGMRAAVVLAAWLFDPVRLTLSRMDLSLSSNVFLTSSSNDTAFLVGDYLQAYQTGYTTVSAMWWASSCPMAIPYNGSTTVTVALPSAIAASITLNSTRLAAPSTAAAFAGISTVAAIEQVTITYPSYSRNALHDPHTTFDTSQAKGLFFVTGVGTDFIQVVPNTNNRTGTGTLIVRFQPDNIIATANITVVAANFLSVTPQHYPIASGNGTQLHALGSSGKFQEAQLNSSLILSDGTSLALSSGVTYIDISSIVQTSISGNIVSVNRGASSGTAHIQATFHALRGSTTISIITSAVTVSSVSSLRLVAVSGALASVGLYENFGSLSGVSGSVFQIEFDAQFTDGGIIPASSLFVNNQIQYLNIFSFTTTSAEISVNSTHGLVTLTANAPNYVVITISSENAVLTTLKVYCNLAAQNNDVHLGAFTGPPVAPIVSGSTFSVPVTLNENSTLGSFSFSVSTVCVCVFNVRNQSCD